MSPNPMPSPFDHSELKPGTSVIEEETDAYQKVVTRDPFGWMTQTVWKPGHEPAPVVDPLDAVHKRIDDLTTALITAKALTAVNAPPLHKPSK